MNVIIFSSLFIGDGVADPVGRLSTARLAAAFREPEAAAVDGAEVTPAESATADASSGLRRRVARPHKSGRVDTTAADPGAVSAAARLLPLQYRVGDFGVKSIPGSLAFFVGSLGAAFGWASLFERAGAPCTSPRRRERSHPLLLLRTRGTRRHQS